MSRSLKTWGTSESALAEMVAHRLDALDATGNPTIAFLARGIEGLVVRITAKGETEDAARALVEAEERELRAILGDLVFGVDDETMEHAVLARLRARGWTLGVAESVTGGLIGARIASVPGASETFRGTIGAYATEVKRSVLGVTRRARRERGVGARRWRRARGACSAPTSGSRSRASPARPSRTVSRSGTVCFGIALPDGTVEAVSDAPARRSRARAAVLDDLAAEPAAPAPRRASVGDARVRRGAAPRRRARRGRRARVADVSVAGSRDARRDQWHLTLQFLGDDADVDAVAGALDGHRRVGRTSAARRRGRVPGRATRRGCCGSGSPKAPTCVDAARGRGRRAHWRRSATSPTRGRSARTSRSPRYRAPTDRPRRRSRALGDEPVGPAWDVDAVTVYESRLRPDGAALHRAGDDPARTGATELSARAPDRVAPRSSARRSRTRRSAWPSASSTIAGRPAVDDVGGRVRRPGTRREAARAARRARGAARARGHRVGRRRPRRGAAARSGVPSHPRSSAGSATGPNAATVVQSGAVCATGASARRPCGRRGCAAGGPSSLPGADALSTNKPTSAVTKKS